MPRGKSPEEMAALRARKAAKQATTGAPRPPAPPPTPASNTSSRAALIHEQIAVESGELKLMEIREQRQEAERRRAERKRAEAVARAAEEEAVARREEEREQREADRIVRELATEQAVTRAMAGCPFGIPSAVQAAARRAVLQALKGASAGPAEFDALATEARDTILEPYLERKRAEEATEAAKQERIEYGLSYADRELADVDDIWERFRVRPLVEARLKAKVHGGEEDEQIQAIADQVLDREIGPVVEEDDAEGAEDEDDDEEDDTDDVEEEDEPCAECGGDHDTDECPELD